MQKLDDTTLLREFVERDSEEAFATLVARHIDKVYSVAMRHTGDPHRAEEITQAVFVTLARKSRQLGHRVILSGWLYQTARLTAVTFNRSEIRRTRREQEAYMDAVSSETESDAWPQIAPLLDSAMEGLSEADRQAVVLRYFDGKSMKEVGTVLGASEGAVKMRLNRAVEKLRAFFVKRGVVLSAAGLTTAIATNSVQAAPIGLVKTVTTIALAKGAVAGAATLGTTAAKGGATAKTAGAMGLFAVLLGPLVVLFPNYLGYRIGLAGAQSDAERAAITAFYRKAGLIVSGLFIPFAALVLWLTWNLEDRSFLSGLLATGLVLIFLPTMLALGIASIHRSREGASGVSPREQADALPKPVWEYRSQASVLGLPLVHIRLGDRSGLLKAPVKAWIAMGNHAVGGLFAFGGMAVAPLSVGGLSIGLLSFGGVGIGVFALGGIALGAWTLFGGLVAGWQAFGGCVAIAWNAAAGDFALAHDFALGHFAGALQANNALARQFIEPNAFFQCAQFINRHWLWMNLLWMIPFGVQWSILVRQSRSQERASRLATLARGE